MSTRGFPITQQRRAERRKQAEERQAEYDKLSLAEKLDRLPPTGSSRQRARLTAALQVRQEKKEAIAAVIKQNEKNGIYEALEHQASEADTWKDSDNKKKNKKKGN